MRSGRVEPVTIGLTDNDCSYLHAAEVSSFLAPKSYVAFHMFLLLPSRTITAFQDPSSPTFVTFNDFLLFQDTTATYIGVWSKTHSIILQRYVNPEPTHPISPRCRALRCKWSLDTEGTVWLEHPRLRFLWHLESRNCKRVYSLGVRISDKMFHTACWHILVLCVLKLLWRHVGVNGGLKEGLILALFSQASRESREDGWMLMQQFLRFRGTWIYFLGKCIRHYKVPDDGSICVSMVEWHLYIHCWIKLPFVHWSTQTSQEFFSVHWGDSVAAVLCLCSAGCWLLRGGYSHSFRYWECGLAYLHIFLLHHDVLFGVWNLQSRRSAHCPAKAHKDQSCQAANGLRLSESVVLTETMGGDQPHANKKT